MTKEDPCNPCCIDQIGCGDCIFEKDNARTFKMGKRCQIVRDWLSGKCRECHRAYLTDADGCGDREAGLSWEYVCMESGCPYTFLKEILRGDYDEQN